MEANTQEQSQRATELTAWACINMTALRQRNAEALRKQWVKAGWKIGKLELNDLLKLIRKMGKFDNTNVDSEFNLDRMVQMQNEAAEWDLHHRRKHRHAYREIPGPVWQDAGEPDEFNESLPRIRQDELYDSDDYLETFDTSFKISYPLTNLGCVLSTLGHKVSKDRLQWPMQIRERPGCRVQERSLAKRGRYDPDDKGSMEVLLPVSNGDQTARV